MSADRQLTLAVQLRADATFDDFVPGADRERVELLRAQAEGADGGEQQILIYAASGSGKSHLLQAACHARRAAGGRAACLDLADASLEPAVLSGWDDHALLALDGLDAVVGSAGWEAALMVLLQERRDARQATLIAAARPVAELPVQLPDLATRLSWGPVLALSGLDDAARREALQRRASARGLELPAETLDYLLTRASRNMGQLDALLGRLDRASLAAKRRLTVPFVRTVMEDG